MWYFILAVSLYICVYTASYGVFEWKNSNKEGAVAIWFFCGVSLVIPIIKIFV